MGGNGVDQQNPKLPRALDDKYGGKSARFGNKKVMNN